MREFLLGLSFSAVFLAGAMFGVYGGPEARAAEASTPKPTKCQWSYIKDGYSLNIGEGGKVAMDADWTKMSNGGWHLVLGTASDGRYIFERCR